MQSNEIWAYIPGYEGKYQASSKGRIKSVDRLITQESKHGKAFTRKLTGRILSPSKCKDGHLYVVLGHGENGSLVHRLVALTFHGPVPPGMEVRHLNGIPDDNRIENLRYGTRTQNILDVFAVGKAWRKLTASDALSIKDALSKGTPVSQIATEFGVSQSSIYAIRNGVTYWWLQ